MTDEQLNALAERFCAAPLPHSVCADLVAIKQMDGRFGTNLMTVAEAKEVLRFVLGETTPVSGDEVEMVGKAIEDAWNGSGSDGVPNRLPPIDLSAHERRHIGAAAIAALHPTDPAAIRNAALEEAARVADAEAEDIQRHAHLAKDQFQHGRYAMAKCIAAAIRGLVKEVG